MDRLLPDGELLAPPLRHRGCYPTDMKHLLFVTVILTAIGCTDQRQMTATKSQADESVQFFNESVLGSAPTDAIAMLLPNATATWAPKQVVLDYKDNSCYGAMIHYERSHPFESLRRAFNLRFQAHENPTFANDPTMGIWRMEDAGFTIQLSDSEDEDSFMAIYIRFVDPVTMADKIDDLRAKKPELFDDFPVEDFTESLRDMDTAHQAQLVPRKTGNTWTSDALQRGDIAAIHRKVLDDSNYILERDYIGGTPLLNAIAFDNLELVQFLLKHGADPNVAVDDGYTCLLTAIESDADESTQIVAELVHAGANIHTAGTNGWTPLHMAAARGHLEKARLLIRAGADVNRRKEIDASETPLMEAAFAGQPSTVLLLLEHGADPSMRDTIHNRTPLDIAQEVVKGPDLNVVDYLRKENIQIDVDEMLAEMDLPTDQLEMMKQAIKNVDITQSYIDNLNELVKTGDNAEVIRILNEHRR